MFYKKNSDVFDKEQTPQTCFFSKNQIISIEYSKYKKKTFNLNFQQKTII